MGKTFPAHTFLIEGKIGVGTHTIERKNPGAGPVLEPMWWVGGLVAEPYVALIKCDFRSHSGSQQSIMATYGKF